MSTTKSLFFPTGIYKQNEDPFKNDNMMRYEGLKKQFSSELMATEVCMAKCIPSGSTASEFTASESTCLRECSMKYMDACMLIEYEMTNFARGVPL